MSKLAKGLLGAFVLAACAVGGDDGSSTSAQLGSVELAIVAPAALPGGMGSRLQQTCTPSFPPGVEQMMFGAAGAPAAMKAPYRVIPASTKALPVVRGAVELVASATTGASMRAATKATGANALTSADGAMEIAATLRGTKAVEAKSSDGLVVYPGGHGDGDVVVRPREDGAEDWLLLARAPAGAIEYDVALTRGVVAVRHVGNTVEFLDSEGAPRLRMAPPTLVDADCKVVEATVAVTGCTVDTDPDFPIGKPHPAPQATSCRVGISWVGAAVKYPAALDPVWSSTANMGVARAFHTAQKLDTPERVLVVGGITWPGYTVHASAELYDPATGLWAATGPMAVGRYSLASSKFDDGAVYVAGGMNAFGYPTSNADLYLAGTWTAKAALATAVAGHTVDVYSSNWVYIAGGYTYSGGLVTTNATAAYYRPSNAFAGTPTLPSDRAWHSSVIGIDGIYLLGGERTVSGGLSFTGAVDRHIWGANTISTHASMPVARSKFDVFRVGFSLVAAGGDTSTGPTAVMNRADIPNPTTWYTGPSMASGRLWAKTAVRTSGPIVTGGYSGTATLATTTRYDNLGVAFPGPTMATARYAHSATALSGDRVLVAGGMINPGESTALAEVLGNASCTVASQCDDLNACTTDSCSGAGQCLNVPRNVASDCDDGDKCNGISTCSNTGQCVTSAPVTVEACGVCNPTTGAVTPKPANTVCGLGASACRSPGLCNGTGAANTNCITTAAAEGTPCGRADVCDPLGIQVCSAAGSCVARPASAGLPASSDPCTTTTCDPARGVVRTRSSGCGLEDPAPAVLDPSLPTSFGAATTFLTEPGSPTGQAPSDVIDPARRAVIRGRVSALDATGAATTPGVTITIKGRPGYGTVTSGDKGEYAIVVDGGGDWVVQYALAGHIPAERHAKTTWNEYTILDDVALVSRSAMPPTTVHQSATGYQAAWGEFRGNGVGQMDGNAARKGLLLFPPGESSSDIPAGDFKVSITELTAFRAGAAAMPATLPAASGYTYAMELAVVGHENAQVNWSAPVSYYVENFLGIPVGETVPLGVYDVASSRWTAVPSGRVIEITGIAADGKATVSAGASPHGISDAERVALADAYGSQVCVNAPCSAPQAVPKKLWRMQVSHFSVYDANWGIGLPPNASRPPKPGASKPPVNSCKATAPGSIIECQNSVLGEELDIPGTPYSLTYRSSRTEVANTTVEIPITGAALPNPAPIRIEVDIEIAGRRERLVRTPNFALNQTLTWTWDRKDAFGHQVEGAARAMVTTRYVYQGLIGATVDFGQFPASTNTFGGDRENRELWLQTNVELSLGSRSAKHLGLGGWQLSAHGLYDPGSFSFHTGRGDTISTEGSVSRVVGGGTGPASVPGAVANGSSMANPAAVAVSPSGKVYWAEINGSIRSVSSTGTIEQLSSGPGGCQPGTAWPVGAGNTIPATDACATYGDSMVVAGDGTLYVADYNLRRILAFKDGTATLIAGRKDGTSGTFVDGAVGAGAALNDPRALALDAEGNLLFAVKALASGGSSWLVKVTPDGKLRRIAGQPSGAACGAGTEDANVGTDACFPSIADVDVDSTGDIYVSDYVSSNRLSRIRVIRPDGAVRRLVGRSDSAGSERGGQSGPFTYLTAPMSLRVDRGSAYYVDWTVNQVRALRPNGRVDEVLGIFHSDTVTSPELGLTTHPLRTDMYQSRWMAKGPAHDLFVTLQGVPANRIGRLKDGLTSQIVDGSQIHELDLDGRHSSTRSRLRGSVLRSFGYHPDGKLASITDQDGNVVGISGDDTTRVITAPNGMQTTLTLDANRYLTKVTAPDGNERLVSMDGQGLLTKLGKNGDGDPAKAHQFSYDGEGRLVTDLSPDGLGSAQKLSATKDDPKRVVVHTTAEGRTKIFEVERSIVAPTNQVGPIERLSNQVVTGQTGAGLSLLTTTHERFENKRVSTSPDGARVVSDYTSDPKYGRDGQFATKTVSETMPTGGAENRATTTLHSRTIASDESEQLDITTVNGAAWQSKFTRATWTIEKKTPLNRISTTVLDSAIDRVASMQLPPDPSVPVTLAGATYAYVATPGLAHGKLESITVGSRVVSFAYDANGYLQTTTAPDGKMLVIDTRDTMGRVTKMTLPGGRVVTQSYDPMGNVLSVVPPSLASHEMTYSPSGNLLASYIAPDLGGAAPRTTSYGYDRDGFLKTLVSPTPTLNKAIVRDAAGRVTQETEDGRTRTYFYWSDEADPTFVKGKGHLKESLATDGASSVKIAYAYKGSRLTAETQTLAGPASVRTLTRDHDNFLRPTTLGLTGHTGTLAYGYDTDGLVTSVGGLTAGRGTYTGLLTGISRPSKEGETFTYDQYGAPLTMLASYNGTSKGGLTLTFDALSGRIVTKDEDWSGFAGLAHKTWAYTYDTSGRLYTADDGSGPRLYEYDANGNLTGSVPDAQDRIVHTTLDGAVTDYTYDDHGNVVMRVVNGGATQNLAWNGTGGLLQSTKSGVTVKYLLDANGRRAARLSNGTLNRTWTYDGQLRIVGEVIPGATAPADRVRLYGYLPRRHLPVMMSETQSGVTKTYRIYGDHLGSLRAVVDSATGSVVQSMQHDPWGKVTVDNVVGPFVRVPFGFAGGMYDEVTGLVRFGAREYDSGSGRWLSKDEARFGGGWNFYEYCSADPINLLDRTGHDGRAAAAGEAIAATILKDAQAAAAAGASNVGAAAPAAAAAGAAEGGAAAVAGGLGGAYLYCLLVDCGNGPLGDFAPADEGPSEGGAPPNDAPEGDAGCPGSQSPDDPCTFDRLELGMITECIYKCENGGEATLYEKVPFGQSFCPNQIKRKEDGDTF